MDNLPTNLAALHYKINQIAQEEGYQSNKLSQIYFQLPIADSEGMTFLESAGQCILETSSLVDQTYPNLPHKILVAKKFKLLSKLLSLKAAQLLEN